MSGYLDDLLLLVDCHSALTVNGDHIMISAGLQLGPDPEEVYLDPTQAPGVSGPDS